MMDALLKVYLSDAREPKMLKDINQQTGFNAVPGKERQSF